VICSREIFQLILLQPS